MPICTTVESLTYFPQSCFTQHTLTHCGSYTTSSFKSQTVVHVNHISWKHNPHYSYIKMDLLDMVFSNYTCLNMFMCMYMFYIAFFFSLRLEKWQWIKIHTYIISVDSYNKNSFVNQLFGTWNALSHRNSIKGDKWTTIKTCLVHNVAKL